MLPKSDISFKENESIKKDICLKTFNTVESSSYKPFRMRKNEHLSIGKTVKVLTNCYKFSFKNNLNVNLFTVYFLNSNKKICENLKKNFKRDLLMKALTNDQNNFPQHYIVYDDSNLLYVAKECLDDVYEYCIDINNKKKYYIRFEKAKYFQINLNNTNNTLHSESRSFLNLMLTQFSKSSYENAYNNKWIGIGNRLYFKPTQNVSRESDLDFLRQILSGISFSILLGPRSQNILNVDQIHGIFSKSELTAIDFFCEVNGSKKIEHLLKNASMNYLQRKRMTNLLKGINLSVSYNHIKEFTIYEVVNKIPEKTLIMMNGEKLTISDYFKKVYNISLQYPKLPLIQMNPRQANILIPMELVKISIKPQRLKTKLEGILSSIMVKKCTTFPSVKFSNINKFLKDFKDEASKYLECYGVKIDQQIETEAKIFPNIQTKYPSKKEDRVFYNKKLKNFSYGIIFMTKIENESRKKKCILIIEHIINSVSKFGCDFTQNPKPKYVSDFKKNGNLFKLIESNITMIKDNEIKNHLIIFVINYDSLNYYGKIKMLCEQKCFIGCHSQILKLKTIEKINTKISMCNVTTNISLKMNGKLGGLSKSLYYDCNNKNLINFKKKFFNKNSPTIFMGADVIHSSEHDNEKLRHPSISAVVGSMDILGAKYAVSGKIHTTTVHKGKQAMETIQYLKEQVEERLLSFEKETGTLPKHIIFFRDGVADSQFKITMDHEVKSINDAFIQKRHGIKFCDSENVNNKQSNGNVAPNTIVSKDIVNPELLDFYAVFHKGVLGTSKPCHVYALYDDWNLTLNEICLISCWMANVCTRCTTPISIPTPCYYADLACTRLRHHYLEKKLFDKNKKKDHTLDIEFHPRIKYEQFFV
ncbi:Protein argonaute-2 [Strongyloides ratti]|uniref:Protein argonaute-2 n=1 Tax=Strongyloides ratti TaxID=34506 RepID=A0A090LB83_STRRB|nr:Protein argonaute-2 [Strongyloides ratti]CEF67041.1 Protein argonaute-2 [Strongyloides ratti]